MLLVLFWYYFVFTVFCIISNIWVASGGHNLNISMCSDLKGYLQQQEEGLHLCWLVYYHFKYLLFFSIICTNILIIQILTKQLGCILIMENSSLQPWNRTQEGSVGPLPPASWLAAAIGYCTQRVYLLYHSRAQEQ